MAKLKLYQLKQIRNGKPPKRLRRTVKPHKTPKMHREVDLGAPVLVHIICPEKIQMSNCQLSEYTLQNTKIYNIISYN